MNDPNSSELRVSNSPLTKPSSELSSNQSLITKPGAIQWFKDLPIRQKQLIGLFTSEIISIVGLVGVGAYLIFKSGRNQLEHQAKSELAVTQIEYNIKIDQMGFGFRGQADNLAIIQVAQYHRYGQLIPPDFKGQVQTILENEIKARQIEYATLVGKNLKIIVNGNQNRAGEVFNPKNLVQIALKTGEQIKTSEIIHWQDLEAESPEHLSFLTPGEKILIRYTITPVKDPQTDQPIAVLVSGDIVNKKREIVQSTLEALDGGYSGIYLYDENRQNFNLITSVKPIDIKAHQSAYAAVHGSYILDLSIPDLTFLQEAITIPKNSLVTQRMKLERKHYTFAAKAIYNYQGEPIGVLVRGTPETALEELTRGSLLLQGIVASLALGFDIILAILLGITITRPIKRLQKATQAFSQGDLSARAPIVGKDEIGHLADNFNHMADRILNTFRQLQERTADLALANQRIGILNDKLKVENLRLSSELDVVRKLQKMVLPNVEELENIVGLEISGYMEPANEVGGDYYDVLKQGERVKIGIGDVTGHGLESGMLMLMTQTVIRTLQNANETDPVRFLDLLNQTLYDNLQRMKCDKHMTLAILDYHQSRVKLSGQHEEVIVVRFNGDIELIDTIDLGFPIGLDDQIAEFISQQDIQLNPSDVMVLYTDGITEAQNREKEHYGLERLCTVVQEHRDKTAYEIRERVIEDVWRFIREEKIFDDITLLVLKQR